MKYKVVVTEKNRNPNEVTLNVIRDAGIDVEHVPCNSEDMVIDSAKNADVLLVGTVPETTAKILSSLPNLKMVGRSGVGVDSVDLDEATELGICVTNTPGINTSEVADHAMALLLSITRKIPELTQKTSAGDWSNNRESLDAIRGQLQRIAGKVVGIVGFGNIGGAFATRIRGFGPSKIIAFDPYVPQTTADLYGVELVDFDSVLSQSDIISVHMPATVETTHIFNDEAFKKMKNSAILINCARGPIIDETALQKALETEEIAHAGIDVTEVEPISEESPLLNLSNLKITPHFAGASQATAGEGSRRWGENAVNVLTGKRLHGLANPDVLKTIAVMRERGPNRWDGIPDPRF